jgi:hypothetical protein
MTAGALNIAADDGQPSKTVRIPSLPGRQKGAATVDIHCEAYKTGFGAAATEFLAQLKEQESWHDDFARRMGDMLADMDARYRRECLALIERLFAAAAPTLARQSSLIDVMKLVEERVVGGKSELSLRVHPDLIAHLPEQDRRTLSEHPLITLEADKSCAASAIDARWAKGGLFHDPDKLIADILNALGENRAPQEGSQS